MYRQIILNGDVLMLMLMMQARNNKLLLHIYETSYTYHDGPVSGGNDRLLEDFFIRRLSSPRSL